MGLGNPGPEYAGTRHNAGYRLVDAAAERWGFPAFRRARRARVALGTVNRESVVVVKPLTFMNRSGAAITPLLDEPAFAPERDLLVVADDVALPLGRFRLRAGGSSGGHNGLKSVEGALRSQAYARLRIGVGPPPDGFRSEYVLGPFAPDENRVFEDLVPMMVDAVECWLHEGIDIAMSRYNQRGST